MSATTGQLPPEMYTIRDGVRRNLGDAYERMMFEGGTLLTESAKAHRETILATALRQSRMLREKGRAFGALCAIAAAVELIEPSGVAS